VRKVAARPHRAPERDRSAGALDPVCPPGSNWLTVKLYAGPALLDRVLMDVVAPVVRDATASGAARQWFYLRFADPEWHLRVRFEGDSARLLGEVLPAVHRASEALRRGSRLYRTVLEPYVREVRRYGGEEALLACEEIFHRDSSAALEFLAGATGDDGLDARWRFAFLGMDLLLVDLGFEDAFRHGILMYVVGQFRAVFRADAALRKGLGQRARAERRALEDLLLERGETAARLAEGLRVLHERSRAIAQPCGTLRRIAAEGRLESPIDEIAGSLLHMHANRILRSAPRPQELVLYTLLENAYDARLARARKEAP
jgi:thiopeptide-type bacteriocin biosynthesis protein